MNIELNGLLPSVDEFLYLGWILCQCRFGTLRFSVNH